MGMESHEPRETSVEKTESSHEEGTRLLMSNDPMVRAEGVNRVRELDSQAQEQAAESYFASTIGGGEMPVLGSLKEQYQVYDALKGTAFSSKFRELEDARLKKYGYGGFIL